MFMAFAAAARSSDLSRQVGAVIAKDDDILSTGANECPRSGGGTYWPSFTDEDIVEDFIGGRDYTLGYDTNDKNKNEIISETVLQLKKAWKEYSCDDISEDGWKYLKDSLDKSPIKDITEYGRVVHAEMTALLTCVRNGISCCNATLYVTTFPCHNCAKHIIASGIKELFMLNHIQKVKLWIFIEIARLMDLKEREIRMKSE